MNTFAYEYYKRNIAVIGVGLKTGETEQLVKISDNTYTTEFKNTPSTIRCYYEKEPALHNMMPCGGQGLTQFSIKLIFLDAEGGPVYFDEKIQTLLALATYKDVQGIGECSHLMQGPIGFNGTVSKINEISKILNGEENSLHSLTLYKVAEDKNTAPPTIILDLHKILVVTRIKLEISEQFFVKPSDVPLLKNISTHKDTKDKPWEDSPAYKWITADVNFSTVCPLPETVSKSV